jgi:hypothetical protein
VGGCVVISDKAQHTRKWALSWAQYRRRDKVEMLDSEASRVELWAVICPSRCAIVGPTGSTVLVNSRSMSVRGVTGQAVE